jgi:hypothetical protein
MTQFTHICHAVPASPTAIRLRLADAHETQITDPIVIAPVDFVADFCTFLTALRARGATQPVQLEALNASWTQWRAKVREQLLQDPWAEKPSGRPNELHGTEAPAMPEPPNGYDDEAWGSLEYSALPRP